MSYKEFERLMHEQDEEMRKAYKGYRMRICIEGDLMRMFDAKVSSRFLGQGFTIWQDIIPPKKDNENSAASSRANVEDSSLASR